ncbi:MAG: ADOP family duplicated permease, partial [Longimicrobiales bacterium]
MKDDRPRRLFRLPFRRERIREEVDEEIQFHLEERTAKYIREGLSVEEAQAAAAARFGDVERVGDDMEELMEKKERAAHQSDVIGDLRHDVAYAWRQVLRAPGFSLVAILTIALAIGASTSVFSVVDGVMLRPLPYEDPDELVMIWADYTRLDVELPDLRREWLSWANFADFRDEVPAVEAAAAFGGWNPTLTGSGDAELLDGGQFSFGMFSQVLAVEPALGRGFLPEEDEPGGPLAVLLSHGFWQSALGGDPTAVGSTVRLNDEPFVVVGIMPEGFSPPAFLGTDVWSPMQFDETQGENRGGAYLRAVGRLTDDASLEVAVQQANQLGRRLEQAYPETNRDIGYNVYPLQFDLVRRSTDALWLLFSAVGVVLLIACVNVANLLLARGAHRGGELAVRSAIGAGSGRLLRQLMTESLILAGIGGVLGAAIAFVGTDLLVAFAPEGTPLIEQVSVDSRVLGFAALVTALAGALFGILPALRSARTAPATFLRGSGRGTGGAGSGRLRNSMVVGQIALTLMLLVGAGLLVRSLQELRQVNLGFEPEGVLTMTIQLPLARYPDASSRHEFIRPLEQNLSAIPGVVGVGSVNSLPLSGNDGDNTFFIEGASPPDQGREPAVWLRRATPGYFDALAIDIVAGRSFTMGDTDEQPQVIIVNETLANRFFGGDAIGQRINVNNPATPVWREIVGVAADVKNFGIRSESRNAMYVPFYQVSTGFLYTTVKVAGDPAAAIGAI